MFNMLAYLNKSHRYKKLPQDDITVDTKIIILPSMKPPEIWNIVKPELELLDISETNNPWQKLYKEAPSNLSDLNIQSFYLITNEYKKLVCFSENVDMESILMRYYEIQYFILKHLNITRSISGNFRISAKFPEKGINHLEFPESLLNNLYFLMKRQLPALIYQNTEKGYILHSYCYITKLEITSEKAIAILEIK